MLAQLVNCILLLNTIPVIFMCTLSYTLQTDIAEQNIIGVPNMTMFLDTYVEKRLHISTADLPLLF